MVKTYNKLVRDNIPDIIAADEETFDKTMAQVKSFKKYVS